MHSSKRELLVPRYGLSLFREDRIWGELQFHFDWFALDFVESQGELSKLFCEWRKMSNEGKATDPLLLDRINRILNEEQKEKTK